MLRYGYTSLVAPVTDVDYDLETRRDDGREDATGRRRLRPVGVHLGAGLGRRSRTASGSRSRSCTARMSRSTARRPRCSTATAPTRSRCDPTFRAVAALAARPRLRVRDRARPRRRRARPRAGTKAAGSSTRRTRSPTSSAARRPSIAERLHVAEPARRARRERGRAADGRGREPASRSVRRDRRRGAVRRRRHDDARRRAAAHDHRVGGVGRSPRSRTRTRG